MFTYFYYATFSCNNLEISIDGEAESETPVTRGELFRRARNKVLDALASNSEKSNEIHVKYFYCERNEL